MPLTIEEYERLSAMLAPDAPKQEVECARYLQHATIRLFPASPLVEVTVELEQRMHFGRSDFLVVGDYKSDVGKLERRVYFWEVKAAQCYAFQRDDAATRVRPTTDLIKAETQLLHYVQEAKGSQMFCDAFEVRSQNVKMGGIIIGRDNRLWSAGDNLVERDANMSFQLRKEVLYDAIQIRLMTWDRILEDLKPADAQREI